MRAELADLPTPNWFPHGPQILDLLDQHRPMVCVELGTNRGCSAIAVGRLIQSWGGHITCVDKWATGPNLVGLDVFVATVAAAGLAGTIRMLQATTADGARRWAEAKRRWAGEIDYLYVDADHSYAGCLADLELWWPFLRVGGLIAGDDYDDVSGDPKVGVTAAWDAFEAKYQQAFERTFTPGANVGRLIWGVKR